MKNLGEVLKMRRKKIRQTPESLYARLKIHPRYIRAMEDNDYSLFDSALHATGFLKIYAEALNLNVEETLALWRREYGFLFQTGKEKKTSSKERRLKFRPNFLLTPGKALGFTGIALVALFFGYLYISYRSYQGPPRLRIDNPADNVVVKDPLVDVLGSTDIDATLMINGEVVLLKPDGSFATSLSLREGINTINVVSISLLEKKTEKSVTVVYRPTKDSQMDSPETVEGAEGLPEEGDLETRIDSGEALETLDDETLIEEQLSE